VKKKELPNGRNSTFFVNGKKFREVPIPTIQKRGDEKIMRSNAKAFAAEDEKVQERTAWKGENRKGFGGVFLGGGFVFFFPREEWQHIRKGNREPTSDKGNLFSSIREKYEGLFINNLNENYTMRKAGDGKRLVHFFAEEPRGKAPALEEEEVYKKSRGKN